MLGELAELGARSIDPPAMGCVIELRHSKFDYIECLSCVFHFGKAVKKRPQLIFGEPVLHGHHYSLMPSTLWACAYQQFLEQFFARS